MKVPGMYVVVKGDYTELKKDFAEMRREARAAATDMSNALGNAVVPSAVQNSLDQLYQNLTKAHRGANVSKEAFAGLGVTLNDKLRRNINLTDQEWMQLQQRMLATKAQQQAEKALQSVARAANLSAREIALLKLKVGDTDGAMRDFGKIAQGNLSKLKSTIFSLQGAIASLGLGMLVKDVFDTGSEVMQLNRAFEAITGSTKGAQAEFAFLRQLADELGMNFYDLAAGYKDVAAAAQGTAMEGKGVRGVFTGIVEAGAALGMSAENVKGSLFAVSQMISKGKVSAEELRRQLGDRLPGAFQIAARAMGVSTAELDDMLKKGELFVDDFLPRLEKELHKTYGVTARKAAGDAARALDKFKESWTDIKLEMANSGFLDDAVSALRSMTESLKDPAVREAMKELASSLGSIIQAMGTVTQYAGLRSISATYAEGMGLVKKGYLDRDEFDRAGFLERQKMVDDAKAPFTEDSSSVTWRGRGDDRAPKVAEVADVSTPVSRVSKADEAAVKKATAALKQLNDEIARMTMGADDYARYQLANEVADYEKALGAANPRLAQFVELKERELKYQGMAKLKPHEVTEFERINRGDSFFGKADADKRAAEMMRQQEQENLSLITEFAEKHREVVLGETDFKISQIEEQAAAYRKAGADSVAVEQWAKEERLKVSRDWQSGAVRALRSYHDEAVDAARGSERAVTTAFKSMEDAVVSFAMKGKFSFTDFTNSVIEDMLRMAVQKSITGPLAGAAGDFLSGSIGGGGGIFSFLGSFFHAGGMIGRDAPTFTRPVDPAIFAGAPRFHTGLLPNEFPAILEEGEIVIPKGGFKAKGGNSGGVNVYVYNNSGSVQARTQQRPNTDGGFDIAVIIEEIDRHMADGIENGTSRTAAAFEGVYGQSRAGGLY